MQPKKLNLDKISDKCDVFYNKGSKWVGNVEEGIENKYPTHSCKLRCIGISSNFAGVKIVHLHRFNKVY